MGYSLCGRLIEEKGDKEREQWNWEERELERSRHSHCTVVITSVTDRRHDWQRERKRIKQREVGRSPPTASVRLTDTEIEMRWDSEKKDERQGERNEKRQQQGRSYQQTSDSSSTKKWHAVLMAEGTQTAVIFLLPSFPETLISSHQLVCAMLLYFPLLSSSLTFTALHPLCYCIRCENG